MTITYYDHFAIVPKRCSKCNRLFWLEPYNIHYRFPAPFIEIKNIYCIDCEKTIVDNKSTRA